MRILGNGTLSPLDDECPTTREVLNRVGDKWSVVVVVLLSAGARRFNDLRRAVRGISQRVLTATLRSLERDGLVKRTVHPTNPPQVEYELTSLGRTLLEPVMALTRWAQGHRAEVERARGDFERERTGR